MLIQHIVNFNPAKQKEILGENSDIESTMLSNLTAALENNKSYLKQFSPKKITPAISQICEWKSSFSSSRFQ